MAETGIITRMHPSVQDIAEQAWNTLLDQQPHPTPFMRHAYLAALEASGSATAATAATQVACCCTQAGAAIAPATSATSTARPKVTRFAGPSVVRGSGHW